MRLWVAIALLFSITPGMSELVETAAHVVAHADLPHHDADPERGCSEHSCTPLAHHCSCHSSMFARTEVRATQKLSVDITQLHAPIISSWFGRVCEPPPLRPPIA